MKNLLLPLIPALLLTTSGCGLLLGNIKPVEEKSETYRFLDLSKGNPDWSRLEPSKSETKELKDTGTQSTALSDIAYQSKTTASIISLNSACRPVRDEQNLTLQAFSRTLLLGISDTTQRTEKDLTVQKAPALETTLEGKLNGEAVKLRAVVLRNHGCIYDLMYVARPDTFPQQEVDFSRFVTALKLD